MSNFGVVYTLKTKKKIFIKSQNINKNSLVIADYSTDPISYLPALYVWYDGYATDNNNNKTLRVPRVEWLARRTICNSRTGSAPIYRTYVLTYNVHAARVIDTATCAAATTRVYCGSVTRRIFVAILSLCLALPLSIFPSIASCIG
jgi:hypothetical protein